MSDLTAHDDAELVALLRTGDDAAFRQLVDDLSPVMLHVARRYVADREAAQDVVQDAWLGVVRGIARFEGRSSLRSWVFSIVINRAKTRGVRDRRVVPSAALTGEPDDSGAAVDPARFQGPDGEYPGHWTSVGAPQRSAEPEVRALSSEALAMVEHALDGLPERQRLVVQLRDVLGMSADEVCGTLQVTQQNQRVLLHRGRSALRAALENYHRG